MQTKGSISLIITLKVYILEVTMNSKVIFASYFSYSSYYLFCSYSPVHSEKNMCNSGSFLEHQANDPPQTVNVGIRAYSRIWPELAFASSLTLQSFMEDKL